MPSKISQNSRGRASHETKNSLIGPNLFRDLATSRGGDQCGDSFVGELGTVTGFISIETNDLH